MKIRLAILIAVLLGLAVAWASKTANPPATQASDGTDTTDQPVRKQETTLLQKRLDERPLPGKEMREDADVSVSVTVDPTPKKNRLLFELTEAHGYYVEQFTIRIWYKTTPDMEREDSPFSNEIFVDKFIPPNGTMTFCAPLVPAEIARAGGDIGASEDWGTDIRWHGRARTKEEAPNPLPALAVASEECN